MKHSNQTALPSTVDINKLPIGAPLPESEMYFDFGRLERMGLVKDCRLEQTDRLSIRINWSNDVASRLFHDDAHQTLDKLPVDVSEAILKRTQEMFVRQVILAALTME